MQHVRIHTWLPLSTQKNIIQIYYIYIFTIFWGVKNGANVKSISWKNELEFECESIYAVCAIYMARWFFDRYSEKKATITKWP